MAGNKLRRFKISRASLGCVGTGGSFGPSRRHLRPSVTSNTFATTYSTCGFLKGDPLAWYCARASLGVGEASAITHSEIRLPETSAIFLVGHFDRRFQRARRLSCVTGWIVQVGRTGPIHVLLDSSPGKEELVVHLRAPSKQFLVVLRTSARQVKWICIVEVVPGILIEEIWFCFSI